MTKLATLEKKLRHSSYWFIKDTMQIYSDEMKVYLIAQWAKLYGISFDEMRLRLENAR